MRSRLIIFALAGSALAAACGSGDDDSVADVDAASEAPAETVPATSSPVPTSAPPGTIPAEVVAPETSAPETVAPTTEPPAADPWQPVGAGPYEVGVSTLTIDDPDGDRPLTVDVWFPLGDDAPDEPLQQYTLLPGIYFESSDAVAADATVLDRTETFPLVVYSHGSGGLRYIHSAYTEALASHGYIVAAADHTGNTAVDRLAGAEADGEVTAYLRPLDVGAVIDAFTDPNHPAAGPWAGQVDADRIAVTGHSFGGFTSIAAVTGFSNGVGTVDPDDRIDAIVPLAPASGEQLLVDEVISSVDVPMMVLVGTDDTTTPVDPNVTRLWDLNDNVPAYRIELVAAEHQTFSDVCAYQRFLPTLADVPELIVDTIDTYAVEGCSEGDMDDSRANELTASYVVRFLDQVFRDGPVIDSVPPDDVLFQSRGV